MVGLNAIHVVPQPDGGGAERLVRELVRRLPAHGVQSSAIYLHNPKKIPLTEREYSLNFRNFRDPRVLLALRHTVSDLCKEGSANLVHTHLTWPLYYVPIALAGLGARLIHTEHSTYNKRRKVAVLRPMERMLYKRYAKVICISKAVRRSLEDWLGENTLEGRCEVVENGSRLFRCLPRTSQPFDEGLKLVSVGSLSWHKGLDIAIHAVAQCREIIESYTILGEGLERAALEMLVEAQGIEGIVSMPGYVEDIETALGAADLGLIPSRWEGFGLVAPEMLSTGLPIVASKVEGMDEVLEGCGAAIQVPVDNVDALVAGIRTARDQLVGTAHTRAAASAHAQQFSLDRMVKLYAELYERVVSERPFRSNERSR